MVGILRLLFLTILFAGMINISFAASLTAELDRAEASEGQSVILTLTAIDLDDEPDFTPLSSEFEILDRSSSSQINMTNGRVQSSRVWQLGLMPLRTGELSIPSFTVGSESSQPLILKVHKAGSATGPKGNEEFILELSVDKQQPYVQEQIILSAKVFQSRSILEGSLSDPKVDDVILERLGNDRTYSAQVDGRSWQVIERKYAVFPQQSGELTLGPLRLVATVRQESQTGRSLFTPTRKITVSSNSVTLKVQPRVQGKGWWLPAESLSLEAEWNQDPKEARVDEPVTRTIILSAEGLHSTQLPEIEVPEIENARIYPDQAEIRDQVLENSVTSVRTEKWAIIPRKAGQLILPEIQVSWFDTVNQTLRTAVLPQEVIAVTGLQDVEQTAPSVTDEPSNKPKLTENVQSLSNQPTQPDDSLLDTSREEQNNQKIWIALSIFALSGWLLTLGIFWLKAKRVPPKKEQHQPNLLSLNKTVDFDDVEKACQSNDPSRINQALLQWAKAQWSGKTDSPRNLRELANKLDSSELDILFAQLERYLYANEQEQIDFNHLATKIKHRLKQMHSSERKESFGGQLPQL